MYLPELHFLGKEIIWNWKSCALPFPLKMYLIGNAVRLLSGDRQKFHYFVLELAAALQASWSYVFEGVRKVGKSIKPNLDIIKIK